MNKYDIIVLGARGSGKTVFLSSMYQKLSIQDDSVRFFLHAPLGQRNLLLAKYDEVCDTTGGDSSWPEATNRSDVPEFTFSCRVRTPDQKIHDAFEFKYWDYAGGNLTDVEVEPVFEELIVARLQNAHALLGILDGHKILALFNNEKIKGGSIDSDINYILPEMENNPNPVHFIVTKWDVFEGKYSLKQVRDRLFQIPRFKQFVEQRKVLEIPIRLIPVSAVGLDFAEPQIIDGKAAMLKKPGASPHPFNVEMPLACVIPDKLAVELKKIKDKEEAMRLRNVVAAPKLSFFDWIGQIFGGAVEAVRRMLPAELRFADASLRRLTEISLSGARAREATAALESARLKRERDASIQQVVDQGTAVAHVIDNFVSLVEILEASYPYS